MDVLCVCHCPVSWPVFPVGVSLGLSFPRLCISLRLLPRSCPLCSILTVCPSLQVQAVGGQLLGRCLVAWTSVLSRLSQQRWQRLHHRGEQWSRSSPWPEPGPWAGIQRKESRCDLSVVICVLGQGWGTSSLGLGVAPKSLLTHCPHVPPSTLLAASLCPGVLPWTLMTLGMRFDNLPTLVALTIGEGHWAKSWQNSVPLQSLNFLSVQAGKESPLPQSP